MKLARSQAGNLLLLVKPALWSSSLELTLQEAPSVQQKEQMSRLLFLLWDKLHATTNKLHGTYYNLGREYITGVVSVNLPPRIIKGESEKLEAGVTHVA